jgi:hypothetical protein
LPANEPDLEEIFLDYYRAEDGADGAGENAGKGHAESKDG